MDLVCRLFLVLLREKRFFVLSLSLLARLDHVLPYDEDDGHECEWTEDTHDDERCQRDRADEYLFLLWLRHLVRVIVSESELCKFGVDIGEEVGEGRTTGGQWDKLILNKENPHKRRLYVCIRDNETKGACGR